MRTLLRGLQVLACFTPEHPELTLTDVARRVGMPKGTVHRFIAALERHGYLVRGANGRGYILGLKILALGHASLRGLRAPEIALPYLERLAQETDESASMAILDGTEIVYVARAQRKRLMSTTLTVGSRLPVYCTSIGKVILAFRDEAEVDALLDRIEFRRFTPHTITTRQELKKALGEVRRLGYAINNQEMELALRSAAAPIWSRDQQVVAGISLAMPVQRGPMSTLRRQFIPKLLKTAQEITDALRHVDIRW
ncbi:MAG: IclR family transcriptional regulator C-terminal domain-containing protein [Armatimonadota bacterium]|nr:IclR family transcriptional regulator C-terminal domain-containing protein [Armatimonadota bacterium]MDR7551194.1 IclR family transcriptional regulator C-terminal domain-containing protein [Armatimonadota bacterium]